MVRIPSAAGSWGTGGVISWSGSPGPPSQPGRGGGAGGGGNGGQPPSPVAGAQQQTYQQQQQGANLPTAWADPSGTAVGSGSPSYNAMRAMAYGSSLGMQGQLSPGRLALQSISGAGGSGGGGSGGGLLSPGPVRQSMLGSSVSAAVAAVPYSNSTRSAPLPPSPSLPLSQSPPLPLPQPFATSQQQPTYHHIAQGPLGSTANGYTAVAAAYPQVSVDFCPSRHSG